MNRKKKILWWLFSPNPKQKKPESGPVGSESKSPEKVIIYSAPACSDSQVAKRFFSEHKVDYQDKNLEKPENRKELVKKYGWLLTPTIIINDVIFLGFGINIENIVKRLHL